MTRLFIAFALLALAVPAAFAAPPAGQGQGQGQSQGSGQSRNSAPGPAQLCAEQLRTMGPANFRSTYAPNGNGKNAMGKCVSRQAHVADATADNAAKKCKAERADANFAASHGGESFDQFYGTNPNLRNAFGKCVSSKAGDAVEDQQEATMNAAKKCKAERADANFATSHGGKSFKEHYGTNENMANAFGKCVSKLAKAKSSS